MTAILHTLKTHAQQMQTQHMRDLFAHDANRFAKFHLCHDGILLDCSKNLIIEHSLDLLRAWLQEMNFAEKKQLLFSGGNINITENRPALHMALRSINGDYAPEKMAKIHETLARMSAIADAVNHGTESPAQLPEKIHDVVNIGIGGSDLGPSMAVQALSPFGKKGIDLHFVSSLDGSELLDILARIDPHTSLFIVSSKSFTTYETLCNATSAKDWLSHHIGNDAAASHFLALTANPSAASEFGIAAENILSLWDWVGGRTSLCSAIGMTVMLKIGAKNFMAMLRGCHAMDEHFKISALDENIPVLLALMHIWNRNFLNASSHAIIPYDSRMPLFPAYLQQLLMESGGKSVMLDGKESPLQTAPIYWGECGSNAQHSFFQLFHQGTDIVPVDFLLAREAVSDTAKRHEDVIASCLAQAQSLMMGARITPDSPNAAWQHCPGNRPSNMIIYPKLTPYYLGSLIALYEHLTFTQSVLWNINPFDQFGVELGKQQMRVLSAFLEHGDNTPSESSPWDSSTLGLIADIYGTPPIVQSKD